MSIEMVPFLTYLQSHKCHTENILSSKNRNELHWKMYYTRFLIGFRCSYFRAVMPKQDAHLDAIRKTFSRLASKVIKALNSITSRLNFVGENESSALEMRFTDVSSPWHWYR